MDTKQENTIVYKELKDLNDFSGFDNPKDENDSFWNDDDDLSSTEKKDVVKKEDKENKIENEESDKSKVDEELTNEELANKVFNEDDEDDEISDEKESESNDQDDESDKKEIKSKSISTVNYLKEKGIIDFELEEDEELTDNLAEDILEDEFEKGIENRVEELFKDLPKVLKDLNKYAINGGDLNTFFNSIKTKNSSKINSELNLEKQENQELITKEILKDEGYDDDYIETQIEFLKDSDKLKMFSEKKFNKWKIENDKKQESILKEQEKVKQKEKEDFRKYRNNVTKLVNNSNEIGNIKLSRKDKKELPGYITDKNIQLQNGAIISQRDNDLYEVLQDETASLQLAYLLKNRNKDKTFNFKNIETIVRTKVTKEVKENVRRNKTNTPKKSISQFRNSQKKELVDFF